MDANKIYDTINKAFSDFMVADCCHGRTETYYMDYSSARRLAATDGRRMGVIVAQICQNKADLKVAITTVIPDDAYATDPIEGCEVHDIFAYLCRKYQLDEHRKSVIAAFCTACRNAMLRYL